MFKNVEYAGLDGNPDLKAKAEGLTHVLANEIEAWRDDVVVRWSPAADSAHVLDLEVALTLPNGVSGTRSGTFTAEDFSRESWLASRCRRVWSALLGDLIEALDARVRESLFEAAEA